jgi:FemAB-related protein (PEP-CTERM system-associated)
MSTTESAAQAVRTGVQAASPQPVHVRNLGDDEHGAWNRFVMSSEDGSLCHLTGWADVVENTLGHKPFRLVAERGNRITGVLPVSWVGNRIFGDCLVSSPLAVYGGICAEDRESHDSLLQAGKELAGNLDVRYLELRNRTEPFAEDLPGRDLYVTFTQDLSAGPDKLLAGLPRDTRYMVRKSMKNGLDWTEDISLDEFYELYARSVHRLGTPVFAKELFIRLKREFSNNCRIFGIRKGAKAIASVFCFYFRDRVMPYYGGSLAEYNRDAPNNLMYWKLIEQSCQESLRTFDFGRSKKGTGSFVFKSSWNMTMTDLPYRYVLNTAAEVPRMSPVDGKFQTATELWKRLPYPVTKIVGPRTIAWIPSV